MTGNELYHESQLFNTLMQHVHKVESCVVNIAAVFWTEGLQAAKAEWFSASVHP